MDLTKNFPLREMLRSQTATRLGFDEQFSPSQDIINNLRMLCENVLQPLRESLGRGVFVNSGYRAPAPMRPWVVPRPVNTSPVKQRISRSGT